MTSSYTKISERPSEMPNVVMEPTNQEQAEETSENLNNHSGMNS